MMELELPTNPTVGQLFVGSNSVTYQWMGSYWSSASPAINGFAQAIADGGYADSVFNVNLNFNLDGGGA